MSVRILTGNALDRLAELPAESVHCCVTSPPYYGLRDYGVAGQIGLELSTRPYVAALVTVFREVHRVLRGDGTLWLNIGDSYEAKNLRGLPWRLAFALRADGWYLRRDIIWSKPNPMPESVTDRCTTAHEYVFMLSKSECYFYDAEAIKEPGDEPERKRFDRIGGANGHLVRHSPGAMMGQSVVRNKRSVWHIPTHPFPEAHFATFPPALVEPCILAGCPRDGVILDPFSGSGTVGLVADRLDRNAILIELNPAYAAMARRRIKNDAPLLVDVAAE